MKHPTSTRSQIQFSIGAVCLAVMLAACSTTAPTATPVPDTPTQPAATNTATFTPTPVPTGTPTETPSPSATFTGTPTPTFTSTPTETFTPTPEDTATPTIVPTQPTVSAWGWLDNGYPAISFEIAHVSPDTLFTFTYSSPPDTKTWTSKAVSDPGGHLFHFYVPGYNKNKKGSGQTTWLITIQGEDGYTTQITVQLSK